MPFRSSAPCSGAAFLLDLTATGSRVDRVGRVNRRATLAQQQPADAFRAAHFLIRRQSNDDVAIRHEPFLLQTHQRCDEYGDLLLDVGRAAALKEAVALGQREGIETVRPVLLASVDHIYVGEKHDRALGARPTEARRHVAAKRSWTDDVHIVSREAAAAQTRGHGRGCGLRAKPVARIDFDELAKQFSRGLMVWGLHGTDRRDQQRKKKEAHMSHAQPV